MVWKWDRHDTELSARPDSHLLRRYLEACATNTAGVVSQRTLNDAAGIAKATGEAYDAKPGKLFLVDAVPAWWTNRLKRLTKRAKRYMVDPSLALAALRVDLSGLMRDGHLLGHMLDTLVVAQLRRASPLRNEAPAGGNCGFLIGAGLPVPLPRSTGVVATPSLATHVGEIAS